MIYLRSFPSAAYCNHDSGSRRPFPGYGSGPCGEIILVYASVTLSPEENEVCQAINDVVTGETLEFTLAP